MYGDKTVGLTPAHGRMRAQDVVGQHMQGMNATMQPEVTIGTHAQMMRPAPLGSKENPYQGQPVIKTDSPINIEGSKSELSGFRDQATGDLISGDEMQNRMSSPSSDPERAHLQYEAQYGTKNFMSPKKRAAVLTAGKQMQSSNYTPVYNESLVSHSGDTLPVGTSEMSSNEKLSQPGVAEFVAKHGSIDQIAQYESRTGQRLAVSTPVRTAVDQRLGNMAPNQELSGH